MAAPPPPALLSAPDAKAPAPPVVTLKQLAAQLTEAHAMPRKQAETVMADVIGLVVEHLKAGDRLRIGGLGILEVKHRPARSGRNPATGAPIQIAASKKVALGREGDQGRHLATALVNRLECRSEAEDAVALRSEQHNTARIPDRFVHSGCR